MQSLHVLPKAIDASEAMKHIGSREHGGQCVFVGVVRDFNDGKRVRSVRYEVYEPLALQILSQLTEKARERWGQDLAIVIWHAHAHLEIGEASVVVGVSSPHRAEAFAACRFLIDALKHEVPIWKEEFYEDGTSVYATGHSLCRHGSTSDDRS